jgi:hypothetical protein
MPRSSVVLEWIYGRQVESAAEPPDLAIARGEQPHVGMRSGRIGIDRMHHAARTHGAEWLPGELGVTFARGRGQPGAAHIAERDTRAIEGGAILDERQAAAAAQYIPCGALPFVAALFTRSVQRLPCSRQASVQTGEVVARGLDFGGADRRDALWLRAQGALRNR